MTEANETATRGRASTKTPNVHEAIAHAMGLVKAVGKEGRNQRDGYAFKRIDDFLDAANDAMSEAGVHQVPRVLTRITDENHRTSSNNVMRWVDLEVEFTFYGPKGDSVVAVTWGEGRDASDKATNKALTAAQKYALMYVLMIPTSDIQDADRDSPEAGASTPAASVPPATPAAEPRRQVAPEVHAAQQTIIDLGTARNLSRQDLIDEFARWMAAAGENPAITIGNANLATLEMFIAELRKPPTPPAEQPADDAVAESGQEGAGQ